jgi:hypothetical protein
LAQEGEYYMDLQEIGWEDMNWIHLGQDRDKAGSCEQHHNEPSDSIKCGNFLE